MFVGETTTEFVEQAAWVTTLHIFSMGVAGIPPLAIVAAMFGSFAGQAWAKPIPGRQQTFTLWIANVGVGCIGPTLIPKLIGWSSYDHESMVGAFAFVCALSARWIIPFIIEIFSAVKDTIKQKIVDYIHSRFPKG